jgi:hypothetical protein
MKRILLVKIHIVATIIAVLTIGSFFIASLVAEIKGNKEGIKNVKEVILFSLPVMLIAMPALGITGNKLGGKSTNPLIAAKRRRMKFVFMNGIALITLAGFLYYRSHYVAIDGVFLTAQMLEFALGLTNLVLIGLNITSGLQLSGKGRRINPIQYVKAGK